MVPTTLLKAAQAGIEADEACHDARARGAKRGTTHALVRKIERCAKQAAKLPARSNHELNLKTQLLTRITRICGSRDERELAFTLGQSVRVDCERLAEGAR